MVKKRSGENVNSKRKKWRFVDYKREDKVGGGINNNKTN